MKIGTVSFSVEYVVDLDNPNMLDYAKMVIVNDIATLCEQDEIWEYIVVEENSKLDSSMIQEFLAEKED